MGVPFYRKILWFFDRTFKSAVDFYVVFRKRVTLLCVLFTLLALFIVDISHIIKIRICGVLRRAAGIGFNIVRKKPVLFKLKGFTCLLT